MRYGFLDEAAASDLATLLVGAPVKVTLESADDLGVGAMGGVMWDGDHWHIGIAQALGVDEAIQTLLHEAAHIALGHVSTEGVTLPADVDARYLAALADGDRSAAAAVLKAHYHSDPAREESVDRVAARVRAGLAEKGIDLASTLFDWVVQDSPAVD
jgi:hypothetical protein